MRLAPAVLAGVLAVVSALGPPVAADTKSDLEAAKRELARIQEELTRATAVWQAAERDLELTRHEIALTRERIGRLEDQIARTEQRLQRRAILSFQSGPAATVDLLLSSASFADLSDRLEFLNSLTQADSDLIVERDVAAEELRREREDLLALEERQAREASALELARGRILDAFARADALVDRLTAKYRAEVAARKELQLIGQSPDPSSPIQVCPVAGPNSFVDSFGWPRVGHTHQGIDLIAPFGTPIVAAHPGVVSHSSSSAGGLQAYVRAPSGTYTFYAHLSSYSAASGSVSAGTVIGYVGSTGNAGDTNHLHFEYHPGGGAAVNPYQMLLRVC